MITIKSRLTGLEQQVSEKTFSEMNNLKPGAHKKIADAVPTPPEAAEPETQKQNVPAADKNKGKTVLTAGAVAPPDATPTV